VAVDAAILFPSFIRGISFRRDRGRALLNRVREEHRLTPQ
jgi:hypothetical protein